jgi:hypothetical protein
MNGNVVVAIVVTVIAPRPSFENDRIRADGNRLFRGEVSGRSGENEPQGIDPDGSEHQAYPKGVGEEDP